MIKSLFLILLFFVPVVLPALAADRAPLPPAAAALIDRAGNSGDDTERLALLKELQSHPDLPASLKADLDLLIEKTVQPYVDANDGKTSLFEFMKGFYTRGSSYARGVSKSSPLKPIETLYNARATFWSMLQSHATEQVFQDRVDKSVAGFKSVLKAFPGNPTAALYLGTAQPWPTQYPDDPDAPEWANLQRRAIEGFTDIIKWWIANRQFPGRDPRQGLYGGTPGDDCEMWRWWAAVMLSFQDPEIDAAQDRLSAFTLSNPKLAKGYYMPIHDVEHASEDFTDSVTPMMHLHPDNIEWLDRSLSLIGFMRDKWMGKNERGFLQFKNIDIGAAGVGTDPLNAEEVCYHSRVAQPAIIAWLRTGNSEIGSTVSEWLRTWVDATAREEDGKPAGVLPAAIHWPDGRPHGVAPEWWLSGSEGGSPIYNFPAAQYLLADALLATWYLTGDEQYLQPIRSMAQVLKDHPPGGPAPVPGSKAWAARTIRENTTFSQQPGLGFIMSVAKYTFLTGDKSYQDSVIAEGGYSAYRLTGSLQPLIDTLRPTAEQLSRNFASYTSEVRWTDRVLRMPVFWYRRVAPEFGAMPDAGIVFNSATGNVGAPYVFPTNAVRWLTLPRGIAALVTDSSRDSFAAELYHFGDQSRSMGAEFLMLKPGSYAVVLREAGDSGKELSRQSLTIAKSRERIEFKLPVRRLCTLHIARVEH